MLIRPGDACTCGQPWNSVCIRSAPESNMSPMAVCIYLSPCAVLAGRAGDRFWFTTPDFAVSPTPHAAAQPLQNTIRNQKVRQTPGNGQDEKRIWFTLGGRRHEAQADGSHCSFWSSPRTKRTWNIQWFRRSSWRSPCQQAMITKHSFQLRNS